MPAVNNRVSIRYGNRRVWLDLPDSVDVAVVGRKAAHADEGEVLRTALREPLGAPVLSTFLSGARNALVVVNDATRSTPTARVLDALLPDLNAASNWHVIVASGLHRGPNEGELRVLFGSHLKEVMPRLLVHNGYDDGQLISVESPAGPVMVNRAVTDADRLILINSVEPHFFAGYTGGRKSIIPGLAGYRTVEESHAGAVSERAAPLQVSGSPVREFIQSRTRFLDDTTIWSIQAVLDKHDKLAAAYAGHVDRTFEAACGAAREYYVVEIERPYDIVIGAIHPPLDLSLYQAMKGWEMPIAGVRDGGVLIVTALCQEGVGAKFYARLVEEHPDQARWASLETQPYKLGLHKLIRTARARRRFRLFAVTGMTTDEVRKFGYQGFGSIESAVSSALEHVGPKARLLVVEDSALTTIVRRPDTTHKEMARMANDVGCIEV